MNKYYFLLACILLLASCADKKPNEQAVAPLLTPSPLETVRALAQTNKSVKHSALLPIESYPAEIAVIVKRGEMVFAMTASDQKPFFFKDDTTGELIGLDVEIAYEIANRLGVKAAFNRDSKSFDDVVLLVAAGKADVALSKLSRTLKRAQLVLFTAPYITFRQALLMNRLQLAKETTEENTVNYIRQMTGTIGVIENSSYVGYSQNNFRTAKILTFKTWDAAVAAVQKGEVLAVYRDELEILKITAQKKDAALTLKPVVLTDKQDPIAIAVNAGSPMLREWLDIFLSDYIFTHQSELNAKSLVNRYFAD